jgi:hypothetical protein
MEGFKEVFLRVEAKYPTWDAYFNVKSVGHEVLRHCAALFFMLNNYEKKADVEVCEGTGYETVEVGENIVKKEEYTALVGFRLTDGVRTLTVRIGHPPGIMYGFRRWKLEMEARYQNDKVDIAIFKDGVYIVCSDEDAINLFCRILHQLVRNAEELSSHVDGRFKGIAYVDEGGTFVASSIAGDLMIFRRGLPGKRFEFFRRMRH